MFDIRVAVRFGFILAVSVTASMPALAQTFNGIYQNGGGEVRVDWSSDFGPDAVVGMGMNPAIVYSGQTLSATVTGDPWPSEIGPASSTQSVQIPQASPIPSGPIAVTQTTKVRNYDGGYGLQSSANADFFLSVSGAGPRSVTVSWKAVYTNSVGGQGAMGAGIFVSGLGQIYSDSFGGPTGSFVKEGTVSGLLPPNITDPEFSCGSYLYQGQGVASEGQFEFTVTVEVAVCGTAAGDASYGLGKAGSTGVPILAAGVPMKIGNTGTLLLSNAFPNTHGYLLIGFSQPNLPFFGGTLLASPDILIPFSTTASGTFTMLEGPIPPNGLFCGITLYHQAVIQDPGATGAPYSLTQGVARTLGS